MSSFVPRLLSHFFIGMYIPFLVRFDLPIYNYDMTFNLAAHKMARTSYNRLSRAYDWFSGMGEARLIQNGLDQLQTRPGEKVLEIGCGTGAALSHLAWRVGEAGWVSGLDLSEGMLAVARRKLAKGGFSGRTGLQQGDALWLPYAAGSFDAIFMSFALELFSQVETLSVLKECWRVLRRGGRLGVVAMSQRGTVNVMTRLYAWLHTQYPVLVDCHPIMAVAAIVAAGFKVRKEAVLSTWGLPVEVVLADKQE